ncbi:ABC transporter substrate-binding protein [Neptunomonas concharum]|jgi:polar amino acid transport system substrate-binding protein|uniref:ABC transporter substrate-binding protein n=1 Tax=Neptunomonas concharum TaxID=1031538 RepID=A0A5P1R6V9_9GAMM|nr:ABC transporter substrate-binding protein [Neptunomonas concharum]QEQ95377.1 ABC transporter substrate-binding protein [Neptunomonas concharum]
MSVRKIVAAVTLVAGAFVGSQAMAGDKIRIATEGAYAPFNMKNEQGELVGFDVEIAKALCAEMKADCTIVEQDWDGMIPALKGRKFDAIVASMSITEDRLKAIDFTDPYYTNALAFVAAEGKAFATDKASLKGKTLGAQRATIAGQYLEDELGDVVTVKLYDTQDNAYLDLASGRLDGLVSDKFPAYDWLRTDAGKGFEFKGETIKTETVDKIGIGIRHGEAELKAKFNKALKAIVENGTYEKINAQYFPFSIY